MFAILLIFPILFFSTNKDFFDQVEIEKEMGAKWHYVGKSDLDPTAKAVLPLQHEGGEPHIYYKLKMPKDGTTTN
jgi:hypothetical protein